MMHLVPTGMNQAVGGPEIINSLAFSLCLHRSLLAILSMQASKCQSKADSLHMT